MTTTKDRTYRVVSVPFEKDLMAFSQVLEEVLNELVENGYSIQVMSSPRGVVVLGQLKPTTRDPFHDVLAAIAAAGEEAQKVAEDTAVEVPTRLKTLLELIEEKAGSASLVEMTKALPRVLPTLLKGAPSEAIFAAAKDCDEIVHSYDRAHKPSEECIFSTFLKALAEQLRGFVKLQVQ